MHECTELSSSTNPLFHANSPFTLYSFFGGFVQTAVPEKARRSESPITDQLREMKPSSACKLLHHSVKYNQNSQDSQGTGLILSGLCGSNSVRKKTMRF